MSKQFKIFLIILAVAILIFAGFKFYQWVNRGELEITVIFKPNASEQNIEQIISEVKGEITLKTPVGGLAGYKIHLPWYLSLPGFKNVEDVMEELESNPNVEEVFPTYADYWTPRFHPRVMPD